MELEINHYVRDIVTKFIDLLSDISQKGITGPSPNAISSLGIGSSLCFCSGSTMDGQKGRLLEPLDVI